MLTSNLRALVVTAPAHFANSRVAKLSALEDSSESDEIVQIMTTLDVPSKEGFRRCVSLELL